MIKQFSITLSTMLLSNYYDFVVCPILFSLVHINKGLECSIIWRPLVNQCTTEYGPFLALISSGLFAARKPQNICLQINGNIRDQTFALPLNNSSAVQSNQIIKRKWVRVGEGLSSSQKFLHSFLFWLHMSTRACLNHHIYTSLEQQIYKLPC